MTGEIGTIGDIATGTLLGRAVEPRAGESHGGARAHGVCLNCGTALIGEYCHACGQNEHVHRTLGSIGHDLLHGVFHFEGKIWRTIPMLVLHPGALTRRYVAGERARFVSPLALFLFTVFLMFATIHTFSGEFGGTNMTAAQRADATKRLDANIAKASAELAKDKAAPGNKTATDIAALEATIKGMKTARSSITGLKTNDPYYNFTDMKTGWAPLDHGIAKANANPGLMLYKLQSSAYKYSWALIPISTPFVALLFLWRRRYKMYDHAIFVTYSLAFMMGLVVLLSLLGKINAPDWIFSLLVAFAPPVHMFAQLRGAYGLRKRSALWRTIALLIFAFVALIAFSILLLAMGLSG
ncbi:hypothetical protein ASG11_15335 [Sphingomonas sp. Leaf357]|uniref:DUF3667 domain-containing protein n=1 Tax=Sphingomonas sp. Leaf357 TaxID=1736350 RepID=UPI0006F8CF94|nr:DUF3667 domain-containing protein [Sphingomonas sp. Leaf357]KQS02153.1 hypothetical protein ASG11_15335 [Sphingomonas sp. Leaf357]